MKKKFLIFSIYFLLIFSSVCSAQQAGIEIVGEERTELIKFTEPLVDSLLEGLNEADYIKYSKGFDEQMKNALPENVFLQTRELIISKIGKYISRSSPEVFKEGPFISIIYRGEFEEEEGVTIKVVFREYPQGYLISGLWFDSPKLRQ